ncbi:putative 3-hydroxybutyryl-CoA dehydrogenase [Bordetella bronchiseptica OSU553]|nr:putative 3-hydroxybutyryl-CoA dehydrogenase [Bordetella bronchiseptica OSU553]
MNPPEHVVSPPIARVAVVGAGTIGASWAALFAARGLRVTVTDPAPGSAESLRGRIADIWPALAAAGAIQDGADPDAVRFDADLQEALRDADFVQENAPERPDFKADLFTRMDAALPPHTIIASSSSGLPMSALQAGCRHPERCVIGHPFNPPHLIPLVEVVAGRQTAPAAIERAMAFYRSLGKYPIRIDKEIPGHVANRLQAALWREAIHLVAEGVASVADIDAAVTQGPGLRWALYGPHMTFHLGGGEGGLAHFLDHLRGPVQTWWDDLGQPALTPALQRKLIQGVAAEAGQCSIAELSATRDAQLTAILAILRQQGSPHP